jgi:hypothetical protein
MDGQAYPYAVIDWKRGAWASLDGVKRWHRSVSRMTLDDFVSGKHQQNDARPEDQ